MYLGLVYCHVCVCVCVCVGSMNAFAIVEIFHIPIFALTLCCLLTCVGLSVGPGLTQREDLARLQRDARREEDDFHGVSLQPPAEALRGAALGSRL